jgi:hypothetical protein
MRKKLSDHERDVVREAMLHLDQSEEEVIRLALRLAIREYEKEATVCQNFPRLSEQFDRQRRDCQRLLAKFGEPTQ